MAQRYRSSKSGSGRSRPRSGSRSSARQPSRGGGGGGGGAGPIILAIVLVIGAVGLIVVLSSGGDDKDTGRNNASRSSSNSSYESPREPDVPKPAAYPPINDHIRQKAKGIADKARDLKKQGEEVYQAAMTARRDGDQDLWQEKLAEASEFFLEIQDLYNELIGEMPSNDHYTEEDVANHYLGREADIVMQATRRLADIKKQRRM